MVLNGIISQLYSQHPVRARDYVWSRLSRVYFLADIYYESQFFKCNRQIWHSKATTLTI